MKSEAEANADADKRMKETADKINTADAQIFQTEKQLKEYGDKIPAEKRAPIESALSDLKDSHRDKNIEGIDRDLVKLEEAWKAASEEMYKATQEAQANPGQQQADPNQGNPAGGKEGEVQDVDFEEVKN
jgi:molecular chaperone DnaK